METPAHVPYQFDRNVLTVVVSFAVCWGGVAGSGGGPAMEAPVIEPVNVGEPERPAQDSKNSVTIPDACLANGVACPGVHASLYGMMRKYVFMGPIPFTSIVPLDSKRNAPLSLL